MLDEERGLYCFVQGLPRETFRVGDGDLVYWQFGDRSVLFANLGLNLSCTGGLFLKMGDLEEQCDCKASSVCRLH